MPCTANKYQLTYLRTQQRLETSNVYGTYQRAQVVPSPVWWTVQMPSCLASKLVWQWPPSFYWLQDEKQPCTPLEALQQSNRSTVGAFTAEPTGWLSTCGAHGQSYLKTTVLSRRCGAEHQVARRTDRILLSALQPKGSKACRSGETVLYYP